MSVFAVIASAAKQSMQRASTYHGLLRYARNDGGSFSKIILSFICIFILTLNTAFGLPPMDQQRLTDLTKEIRCVVCQNQSIADSRAPLANDLREKIALMITQHESDDAIKNYLVKRYGEFILLKPRLSKTTFLLWIFPFIGLGVIAWLLYSKNMIR